jgi:hypothetical protein
MYSMTKPLHAYACTACPTASAHLQVRAMVPRTVLESGAYVWHDKLPTPPPPRPRGPTSSCQQHWPTMSKTLAHLQQQQQQQQQQLIGRLLTEQFAWCVGVWRSLFSGEANHL